MRDYWKHSNSYSKGRKKLTKQLIPKKVWVEVYKDYVGYFPSSTFKENSLKDHLRDNLKDMKSGVNNPEELEGAGLQDEDLIIRLT